MKIIEITNQDGSISEYTIRKLSPIEGREIILGYLASMLPLKNKYPFNNPSSVHRIGKGNGDCRKRQVVRSC